MVLRLRLFRFNFFFLILNFNYLKKNNCCIRFLFFRYPITNLKQYLKNTLKDLKFSHIVEMGKTNANEIGTNFDNF